MTKMKAYKHGVVMLKASRPIIFFSESHSPKLTNGLQGTNRDDGLCSLPCFSFATNLPTSLLFFPLATRVVTHHDTPFEAFPTSLGGFIL
jgi:hypothetical protein